MKSIILVLATIVSLRAHSQPDTEIYLFNLEKGPDGNYKIHSPINISNNEGYDNQPTFWSDGKSIIYSRNVNGQTEIARYFVGSGETKIITQTPQGSEYSPTPMPDGRISSIRLDTTGLQLLYAYDLSGKAEVLVEDLVIGYHAWVDKNAIAAFVLGEPNTLQYINLKSKKIKTIANTVGRSIHNVPDSKFFSFVDKKNEPWTIKIYHTKNDKSQYVTNVRAGAEDYCWTPSKDIVMGDGSTLWNWNGRTGWKMISDLAGYGLKRITRLTVSPDGTLLALVVEK